MDQLQTCAIAFEHLLGQQYYIIAGKKGKTVNILLSFSPERFHHLLGLHKLVDLRIARADRETVFSRILSGEITLADLEKSDFFKKIANRIEPLTQLESRLDDNNLIFKYNENQNNWSWIQAKFLLISRYRDTKTYLFLDQEDTPETPDEFFCRSFFPDEGISHELQQPRYTLLYKEKRNCLDGSTIIQYNHLSKPAE